MTPITRRRASARRGLPAALALICCGAAAAAQGLDLPPGARLVAEQISPRDSYALPLGPWADGRMPALPAEGRVTRRAWRLPGQSATTLQILAPLREQLKAAGYEILFECRAETCGGFDFRFATEVLPAPEMQVDLTRFRFLSALRTAPDGRADHVSVLVSRTEGAGYLQIIHVAPESRAAATGAAPAAAAAGAGPGAANEAAGEAAPPLVRALQEQGHAVLRDLEFASGEATLGQADFDALAELAAFLRADAGRVVVLVGHTDAVGGLEPNLALSRRRAEAVRQRLIARHGVPARQLRAQGAGYLAPLASNLTEQGRETNRRVEAVLLPDGG